jgi:hypothetical protein
MSGDTKTPAKPSVKDVSELTPSGMATKEAGKIKDDASDDDKVAWNDKYLEAKLKARRG